MRRCDTIWARKTGMSRMRMVMVSRMMAIPMSPVRL
jgi:hypothetical protein